jgi:hypothetical protein
VIGASVREAEWQSLLHFTLSGQQNLSAPDRSIIPSLIGCGGIDHHLGRVISADFATANSACIAVNNARTVRIVAKFHIAPVLLPVAGSISICSLQTGR